MIGSFEIYEKCITHDWLKTMPHDVLDAGVATGVISIKQLN